LKIYFLFLNYFILKRKHFDYYIKNYLYTILMNENHKIKILVIRFKNPLQRKEIAYFRGAVIHAIEDKNTDILFHNHTEKQFRYSYPLIQYKRINKKAAIVCIQEGTEAIGQLFSSCNFTFDIGKQKTEMEVESMIANQPPLQVWDSKFKYRLRNWLPLSQESYQKYKMLNGLIEKVQFLEHILTGNMLSFAKGVGIYFDKQITCRILHMEEPTSSVYKEVKMLSFDLEFESNVSLPDFIGLGKGSSIGYGIVTRKRD